MRSFIVFIVLITSCQSAPKPPAQQEILDSFQKLDSGLRAGDTLRVIPPTLPQSPEPGSATAMIAQLKAALLSADPGGEQTGIADRLIIRSGRGQDLYDALRKLSHTTGDTSTVIAHTHRLPAEAWMQRYFRGLPTIAAITILSQMQNELDSHLRPKRP